MLISCQMNVLFVISHSFFLSEFKKVFVYCLSTTIIWWRRRHHLVWFLYIN